jgi:2-desacetyl-2-hydroxyethyl bacteriochlorophyllide A dehydrogenase
VIPEKMPAAVYIGQGALEVHALAVPEPREGEVLLEVSHCGICGTDLHLALDDFARPGTVLGHEWSATVAATGPGVTGWEGGEAVVVDATPGCGECRACRRGRPSVCLRREPIDLLEFSGAFTRYVTRPAARLLPLPSGLPLRTAALTEPTAIALHTVELAGVGPDDHVLITGGGPVGLLTLAVLRSLGVEDVTVSEPSPVRRELAAAVGAARVVTPDALAAAPMGRPVDDAYTFAFECSGRAPAAEAALDQLDLAGTLVFVGTGHEPPRVNHNRVIILELALIGAYNYGAQGFAPALELLASGRLPVDLLIEPGDVALGELQTTMERLARGEIGGKVLVRPEA